MKKIFGLFLAVVILAAGLVIFWKRDVIFAHREKPFVLYGNVDDRQLNLAFSLSERIETITVEEGDHVKKGQLIATLESVRIHNSLLAAQAALAAAEAKLEKLQNGTRREDIEIARSGVQAAEAKLKADENEFQRQQTLQRSSIASMHDLEKAEATYLLARAAVSASKSNLEKQLAGPRKEEIAEAAAQVAQMRAQVAIQEQMLSDTKLVSPCDGVVRNRLLHPGEMTAPQSPVLTLAILSPKWVRTYLPEPMLTRIKSGEKAAIHVDGLAKAFSGWVGFISPNAEFTPKNVETPELRSSLVYEVRVMVDDPDNLLKLGSPATVTFPGVPAE